MRSAHPTNVSFLLYTLGIMATAKLLEYISAKDYLAAELESDIRHEYVDGRLYAMAGASDVHNRITVNLTVQLYPAAESKGCRIYAGDMKAKVNEYTYYYPDIMVVCADDGGDYTKERPCLVVEVLSRTTRASDKREKREAYLAMPSLQSYLLIDSEKRSVTSYERSEAGWLERTWEGDAEGSNEVAFTCLGTALTLDNIYRGVTFGQVSSED